MFQDCSGTSDSDSGRDSGVMQRHDVTTYDRAPSSTYSENNYAEIPSPDTFSYRQTHPATRYVADLPGNYVFNDINTPADLPRAGNQGSPDSGVSGVDRNNFPGSTPVGAQNMSYIPPVATTRGPFQPTQPIATKIPELATIPLPDRRHPTLAECEFYQTQPTKTVKHKRSALQNIIIMACIGLIYLALGITAGYFIGKGGVYI